MQKFNTLTASINHSKGRRRNSVVSHITVKLGPVTVAKATLGGKYNEQQAVKEFTRLPHRFTKLAGFASAKQLGLVA